MSQPLITIQIPNLPQLQYAFAKSPVLMRRALPAAINKSLLAVGRQAAINAPVRTGNLRSSILDPNRGLQLATPTVFEGYVGSGTNYGLYVELGTRFMASRPYLRPAVNSTKDQVRQFFMDAVNTVLIGIAGAAK